MMPAAKHFDPVLGVDVHIIQPPGPVPPVPIPHPHVGMVIDPMDYAPIIGGTVKVGGLQRAQAGTAGKAIPPHIPIGGVFVKPPSNESEIFMGSSTVEVDGDAFSYMALPSLSCQCIGMPPPPRAKASKAKSLLAPFSVVLAVPAGNVLVGGAPTISLMAMAMKIGLGALGKGFKKLKKLMKKSKKIKGLSKKLHKAAGKAMDKLGVPKKSKIRNKVHKKICSVTGHPVDVATGKVFTDAVDLELPGPIPFKWERTWFSTSTYEGPLGYGWHHSYDFGLIAEEGVVAVRMGDGRSVVFRDVGAGEELFDSKEKLTLFRDDAGYALRNAEQITYRFGLSGRSSGEQVLASIEDGAGHRIELRYDEAGNLRQIVDSQNRLLELEVDQAGRIVSLSPPHPTDADGRVVIARYGYSHDGDLTVVRDALDRPFQYAYDRHLLVQETNRNGLSFYFEYDGADDNARCVHTWGDGGIFDHKLSYFEEESLTVVEDSLGNQTRYHVLDGLVVREVNPLGAEWQREFDDDGNKVSETDPLGNTTQYTYDERGELTELQYPDGGQLALEYDGEGKLVSALDLGGGSWAWSYDDRGRVVDREDPLGQHTKYVYYSAELNEIIDRQGNARLMEHDEIGNLTTVRLPNGSVGRWEHDRLGRIVSETDLKGNVQKRTLDLLGRVVKLEEADGNVREFDYDGEGNIVRARDLHHDLALTYTGMGLLASQSEAGSKVEFHHDTEGRLVGVRNEQGLVYEIVLDSAGEVVEERGFDGQTKRYIRDKAGRVVELVRPSGQVTKYDYDPVGRLAEVEHPDGSAEIYLYRQDGVLIQATNDTVSVRMEVNALGQVVKEWQGDHWVASEYDAEGMRVAMESSLGASQKNDRDALGDVTRVSADAGGDWEAVFARDSMGIEVERLLPGNVKSRWKLDHLGRPAEQRLSSKSFQDRVRSYKWEVNNRLKELADSKFGDARFHHDPRGNLASVERSTGVERRFPDAVGNLFGNKDRSDRRYGPAGQLLEANGTRYRYDADGNLQEKVLEDGRRWRYSWNGAGLLTLVECPDGRRVEFSYDALGRRVSKRTGGKTTRWVWDGDNPLHEWTEVGVPMAGSVGGNGPGELADIGADKESAGDPKSHPPTGPPEPITWLFEPERFAPLAKFQGGERFSIVNDHLGSPIAMFDASGQQVWSAQLNSYGLVHVENGEAEALPFRFPGQYEDAETGLHYNRFRYYDPDAGAYISQDPIGIEGGLSLYAYVPDPSTWVDTLGLAGGGGCKKAEIVWPSKPHCNKTPGHWEAIQEEAEKMAKSGKYKKIYVNKGLSNEIPGAKPNRRPDIMGVRKDGKIDQVEVASKTDDPQKLRDRMKENQGQMGDKAGSTKLMDPKPPDDD